MQKDSITTKQMETAKERMKAFMEEFKKQRQLSLLKYMQSLVHDDYYDYYGEDQGNIIKKQMSVQSKKAFMEQQDNKDEQFRLPMNHFPDLLRIMPECQECGQHMVHICIEKQCQETGIFCGFCPKKKLENSEHFLHRLNDVRVLLVTYGDMSHQVEINKAILRVLKRSLRELPDQSSIDQGVYGQIEKAQELNNKRVDYLRSIKKSVKLSLSNRKQLPACLFKSVDLYYVPRMDTIKKIANNIKSNKQTEISTIDIIKRAADLQKGSINSKKLSSLSIQTFVIDNNLHKQTAVCTLNEDHIPLMVPGRFYYRISDPDQTCGVIVPTPYRYKGLMLFIEYQQVQNIVSGHNLKRVQLQDIEYGQSKKYILRLTVHLDHKVSLTNIQHVRILKLVTECADYLSSTMDNLNTMHRLQSLSIQCPSLSAKLVQSLLKSAKNLRRMSVVVSQPALVNFDRVNKHYMDELRALVVMGWIHNKESINQMSRLFLIRLLQQLYI